MRGERVPKTDVQPGEPSDAELGIGEEHDLVAAFFAHPDAARLIDNIVQQRLAAMGHAPSGDGMSAVVNGIERLLSAQEAQQPGYAKRLPVEEVERRQAGFDEMVALVEHAKTMRPEDWPRYRLVTEPLFAGEIEYRPGSEIQTLLFPNEHMLPLNDMARQVHAAMMRWIGGPQMSIAERVEEAERERRRSPVPDSSPFARAGLPDQSPVRVVADPPEERGFDPRRPPQAAHEIADAAIVHRI